MTVVSITKKLGAALKPIPVSDELLGNLDPATRLAFFKKWTAAIKGGN
jgi:hypothetical protein